MSGEDIPRKRNRRIIGLVIIFSVITIIIFVVVSLISNDSTGALRLTGLFSRRSPEITVDEFSFDIGRERMFSHIDGSIAAAGTLGVMVIDGEGRETLRDSFRMSQPAIKNHGSHFIAFDIGGTAVRVYNGSQLVSLVEIYGSVVSASINKNGWYCVVTHEGGSSRGVVSIYNNSNSIVYRVRVFTGFVLSAQLSHDNNKLAILTLTDTGSRISLYHGIDTEEEPFVLFDRYNGLIIDIMYLPNGDLLAISTKSLFLLDTNGEGNMLYSFADKRLGGYAQHNDFIALHLYDYGVGHQGRLITFRTDGTLLGEISFNREVISMSAVDNALVVLRSDGVLFYNEELEEFPVSADNITVAGTNRILAVNENLAVATSDHSAIVVRRVD